MAFPVSPGISINEIDTTTRVPAIGTTVGALVGPTQWGEAGTRVLIDSELAFLNTFGGPDNYTAPVWFTASNFFSYANALWFTRVLGPGALNATAGPNGEDTSGHAISVVNGTLIPNDDAYTISFAGGEGMTLTRDADLTLHDAVFANTGGSPSRGTITTVAGNFLTAGFQTGQVVTITGATAPGNNGNFTVYGVTAQVLTITTTFTAGIDSNPVALFQQIEYSLGNWAAKFPGELGNSIAVGMADATTFATWAYKANFDQPPSTSDSVKNAGGSNDELHIVVVDLLGKWTGTPGTVLERYPYVSKCSIATAADGTSIYYANVINRKSAYIRWMGWPADTDWGSAVQSTAFDVLAPVLTVSTSGAFTIGETVKLQTPSVIFSGGGGSGAAGTVVMGTGLNSGKITAVTITAPGSGYSTVPSVAFGYLTAGTPYTHSDISFSGSTISTVAGNFSTAGFAAGQLLAITGSASNNMTVHILTVLTLSMTVQETFATEIAGAAITLTPSTVALTTGGATAVAVMGGTSPHLYVTAVNVTNGGAGYNKAATVVAYTNVGFKLTVAPTVGEIVDGDVLVGLTSGSVATVHQTTGGATFDELMSGVSGNSVFDTNASNTHYLDAVSALITGYELYKSGDDVDIALLMGANASDYGKANGYDGGIALINEIIDVVEFRKDCVAFISPPSDTVVNNSGHEAVDIVAFRQLLPESSYGVIDCNWKYQYDKYNDLFRWVPLNGDLAGLCVNTDEVREPWYSPAGFNRGQIKNVVRLAWNPRQTYRDLLYQNGINPVITTQGQGTILYGDKTMLLKPSAFDRINVRRLFIVLEKSIATAAKYSLFEFNDAFTRASFVSMVDPFLRAVKGGRGIYDYRVVCDETNNTPQIIDANQFVGDIYIKPARSINFIQLNFIAVGTGVSFDEIVGRY